MPAKFLVMIYGIATMISTMIPWAWAHPPTMFPNMSPTQFPTPESELFAHIVRDVHEMEDTLDRIQNKEIKHLHLNISSIMGYVREIASDVAALETKVTDDDNDTAASQIGNMVEDIENLEGDVVRNYRIACASIVFAIVSFVAVAILSCIFAEHKH